MIPDLVVRLYRLVPPRLRGWAFRGWSSTSHLYEPGGGWAMIGALIGDSKPPRPKMPHE